MRLQKKKQTENEEKMESRRNMFRLFSSIAKFTAFAVLFLTVPAFGQVFDNISQIHIATPEWENQTQSDGTGLFFDIIRSVYEPAGIKMTFDIRPWERAREMISSHKADAMLCVFPPGEGFLTPENPLYIEHTAAVFKKGRIKEWNGLKTLKNRSAVWIRGYNYHNNPHMKNIKLKWHEADTYDEAWTSITKDNGCDVYIDALVDIELYVKHNQMDISPYQLKIIWKDKSYMGFSKTEKSKKLIEIYDKRIKDVFSSGELEKIFEKWHMKYAFFKPTP
jgi:ABC-type amino acid transport substrate-binding protein